MADVTVVGGGIIGICSALALQEGGHDVEIIEREAPGGGATFGNCGLLAAGEIVPISKPGVLKKIPKWLLDSQGPLRVRPGALLREMPWLLRFLWSGRLARVREIARALEPLTMRAQADYTQLLGKAGLASNLLAPRKISSFSTRRPTTRPIASPGICAAALASTTSSYARGPEARRAGVRRPDRLRRHRPALGAFSDLHLMAARLADVFAARGGSIRIARVAGIAVLRDRATALTLGSGEALPVNTLVVAAGAWSRRLVADLNLRTPLAALQGYHFHVPQPRICLEHAVLYANGGFAITPMETGLRLAGTIEVSGERAIVGSEALAARPGWWRSAERWWAQHQAAYARPQGSAIACQSA